MPRFVGHTGGADVTSAKVKSDGVLDVPDAVVPVACNVGWSRGLGCVLLPSKRRLICSPRADQALTRPSWGTDTERTLLVDWMLRKS